VKSAYKHFENHDSPTFALNSTNMAELNQYFHLPLCSIYKSRPCGSGSPSFSDWVEYFACTDEIQENHQTLFLFPNNFWV